MILPIVDEDQKMLQGTWRVVSIEGKGKKATPEEIKEFKWIITADKITWTDKNKNTFLYKLDPTKNPKTIDLAFPEARIGVDEPTPGIYLLEGDNLKICIGKKERPTEFADTAARSKPSLSSSGKNPE